MRQKASKRQKQPIRWYGCHFTPRGGDLFTPESARHPAKMAVGLCERIFTHGCDKGYWKPGDLVLDPMAGIGTTLVVGATLGYRVVGVELEQHFQQLAQANIAHAEGQGVAAGRMELRAGDSRQLGEILAGGGSEMAVSLRRPIFEAPGGGGINVKGYGPDGSDKVGDRTYSSRTVTGALLSPPYADSPLDPNQKEITAKNLVGHERRDAGYSGAVTSPPYGDMQVMEGDQLRHPGFKDKNPASRPNSGADKHAPGHIGYSDAVVTSPPYGDLAVQQGAGVTHRILKIAREQGMAAAVRAYRVDVMDTQKAHGRWSDENIQRHIEMALATAEHGGYGAAITSPPYGNEGCGHGHDAGHPRLDAIEDERREREGTARRPAYSSASSAVKSGAQIGNLRDPKGDVDAVLSSPPYEGSETSFSHRAGANKRNTERVQSKSLRGKCGRARDGKMQEFIYGKSKGQIGNQRGETYCAAMLRVYQQLHSVLKPAGVVALVTKNPVKDGKIRRLDLDTIRLMQAAGFTLVEHIHAMLTMPETEQGAMFGAPPVKHRRERKSFFKRLHEKKYPHLRVDHEDVLFFEKGRK